MFNTLTSRFGPFSLKTRTSRILAPTCWPRSESLFRGNKQTCFMIWFPFHPYFSSLSFISPFICLFVVSFIILISVFWFSRHFFHLFIHPFSSFFFSFYLFILLSFTYFILTVFLSFYSSIHPSPTLLTLILCWILHNPDNYNLKKLRQLSNTIAKAMTTISILCL